MRDWAQASFSPGPDELGWRQSGEVTWQGRRLWGRRAQRLKVVNPGCAGVDVGKDRHVVAVDPQRSDDPVRSFRRR